MFARSRVGSRWGLNALLLVIAVCLTVFQTRPISAQDEQPAPGEEVVGLLPLADAFGPGWKRFEPAIAANLTIDTFRDGVVVSYGGPEGARVLLFALLVDEGRVRRGWEEASLLYNNALYNVTYDYERPEQLRNVPPPPGCAEAKRVDGTTSFDGFEIGVTLCAADPDVILLAVASGRVNDEIGFAAADNVIVAALDAAGFSTEAIDNGGDADTDAIRLEAYDIGWRTADQPGPSVSISLTPGTTIAVVNTGGAAHDISVPALAIFEALPPGAEVQIEIPADTAPGEYEFLCTVPGHAPAGMVGTITVE